MEQVRPQSFARRSPIHHALQAEGAVFAPLPGGDAAVAAHYDDPAAERAAAGRLALADLVYGAASDVLPHEIEAVARLSRAATELFAVREQP